jgi:hypothetical protein
MECLYVELLINLVYETHMLLEQYMLLMFRVMKKKKSMVYSRIHRY